MTRKTQVSAVLVATFLATGFASTVSAQEAGSREDRRAEIFSELDQNNDGSISAEEFVNRPDRFARADVDGNGLLTAKEIAAVGQDRAERRVARMIERLDQNGDGALSQEEIEARRDPARMFERLDANSDGVVSEEEFADARFGKRGGKGFGRW